MKFTSYLDKKNKKRLMTKRLVTYLMYLLAPAAIFATAFTNDRIIAKIEAVQELNESYADSLKNCGSGIDPKLIREVDILRGEVERLESGRNETPCSSLATELRSANNEIDRLIAKNERLEELLEASQNQTVDPNSELLSDCKAENEELRNRNVLLESQNESLLNQQNNNGSGDFVPRSTYDLAQADFTRLRIESKETIEELRKSQASEAACKKARRALELERQRSRDDGQSNGSSSGEKPTQPIGVDAQGRKIPPTPAPGTVTKSFLSSELAVRSTNNSPYMSTNLSQSGKVIIKVCLNRQGSVIKTFFIRSGSTTNNSELIEVARKDAKLLKFSPNSSNFLPGECGKILYEFTGR